MPAISLACLCSSACLSSTITCDRIKFLGGGLGFYFFQKAVLCRKDLNFLLLLQLIFNNLLVMVLHIRILMYEYQIKYVCT